MSSLNRWQLFGLTLGVMLVFFKGALPLHLFWYRIVVMDFLKVLNS